MAKRPRPALLSTAQAAWPLLATSIALPSSNPPRLPTAYSPGFQTPLFRRETFCFFMHKTDGC